MKNYINNINNSIFLPSIDAGRRILWILPGVRRHSLLVVMFTGIVAAILETLGVASILPFMSMAVGNEDVSQLSVVQYPLEFFDINQPEHALTVLGFITVSVLTVGNFAGAINQYFQIRFIALTKRELSIELFDHYINQPYAFHLHRDSPSLTKVIYDDIEAFVSGYLSAALSITTKSLLLFMILAMLVWHEPTVAIYTILSLGGAYALLFKSLQRIQSQLSKNISDANVMRARALLEGLGGIKDLKVLGRERYVTHRFSEATVSLTNSQLVSTTLASIPRYAVEVIAFGGLVGLTMMYTSRGQEENLVPTLALLTLAAYRLMPAIHQIYSSAATMRFNSFSVKSLQADLLHVRKTKKADKLEKGQNAPYLTKSIELKSVNFAYEGSAKSTLEGITLTLHANETVGIVGPTGSGKSTFVDLLLGLHSPTTGTIFVDGVAITAHNARMWCKNVGYVPQTIYLMNCSIAENIAFGIPSDEINIQSVERAAREAQIHEFIARLPSNYQTIVGERGVKLSGGQRQRLGIARALYNSPQVLIFDEATSSLDGITEDAVMSAIQTLSNNKTILLIAHRLRTIQACKRIIMIDHGRIVADGPYNKLAQVSHEFRRFARVDNCDTGYQALP